MNIHGKVAVITGASSGIGKALAHRMAGEGAKLLLAARRLEKLESIVHEIEASGGTAAPFQVDVTKPEQVHSAISKAIELWGRLDIFVANAGQYVQGPLLEAGPEKLQQAMDVNYYGALTGMVEAGKIFKEQRSGAIVSTSSFIAFKGIKGDGPYTASKFALKGAAEVLRQEMREYGVTVTTVFPGRVDTDMIAGLKTHWSSPWASPEAVAAATLKGLKKGRPEVIFPSSLRRLALLNTAFPRFGDWLYRVTKVEGTWD